MNNICLTWRANVYPSVRGSHVPDLGLESANVWNREHTVDLYIPVADIMPFNN